MKFLDDELKTLKEKRLIKFIKICVFLFGYLLVCAALYAGGSFVFMDWNPAHWTQEGRVNTVLIWTFVTFVAAGIVTSTF